MKFLQNILWGAGSIMNIYPTTTIRKKHYKPAASDSEAIRHDFEMIGKDLWKALDYERRKAEKNRTR